MKTTSEKCAQQVLAMARSLFATEVTTMCDVNAMVKRASAIRVSSTPKTAMNFPPLTRAKSIKIPPRAVPRRAATIVIDSKEIFAARRRPVKLK